MRPTPRMSTGDKASSGNVISEETPISGGRCYKTVCATSATRLVASRYALISRQLPVTISAINLAG